VACRREVVKSSKKDDIEFKMDILMDEYANFRHVKNNLFFRMTDGSDYLSFPFSVFG